MKFSYQWISELVGGLDVDPAALERLITMKTAECEGIEPFGAHLSAVRVVRVLDTAPVDGGRNKYVRIETGNGSVRQVVCGAPNVRAGMLAIWVPPGTSLAGKMIGTAVIDGIESEGMLASAAELELGRDHSGILEVHQGQPGEPLSDVQPDWVIDIDNKSLTHRPDLWGHHGMAREIAAITGRTLLDPASGTFPFSGASPFRVEIEDFALCPRYSLLALENLVVGPSPLSLAARLESIGLNSISNIVDVTNYVLAELPQPMHAFDADKLSGDVILVRKARSGERLAALNGETYHLQPEDLVITDASGPIALAGVIGGSSTAISSTTKRVVLESANFQAASVRLTSARHKLRTDASARFEKALDPDNTVRGLIRAYALIQGLCPEVRAVGGIVDLRAPQAAAPSIALPAEYVSRKLGKHVSADQIAGILRTLGFAVSETAPELLTVTVPSWRATKDISNKADLVEEIGRMIGYGEITPTAPFVASVVPPSDPFRAYLRDIRRKLAHQGFSEIYSYSFLNPAEAERFDVSSEQLLPVTNPIAADFSHMRPTLLPGVFKAILQNVKHQREFRFFEIGREIHARRKSLPDEITHVVAAIYSAHADEQEFFEMKRVLECILPGGRVRPAEARSFEHPARAASVDWRGTELGRLFELHPLLLEQEGVEGRAVLLDLDLRAALQVHSQHSWTYVPPRRYPTSPFDLSVIAPLHLPVAEIHDALVELAGSDLAMIEFVRQYDGPPLPQGQKSVTYHLEVGALDHTVTMDEVNAIRRRITEGMRERGFDFRG